MATSPKAPSLYSRIQTHGTLTESPRDVPDARFALPSTVHWMCALAILSVDQKLNFAAGRAFYAKVQSRSMPEPDLNTVCEQLLFVLNQIAALQALASAPNKADVANGNRRLVLRDLQRRVGHDGGDGRLVSGRPYGDGEEVVGTLSGQESGDASVRGLPFESRCGHGRDRTHAGEGKGPPLAG
jgi:hypothetical protein